MMIIPRRCPSFSGLTRPLRVWAFHLTILSIHAQQTSSPWIDRTMALLTNRVNFTRLEFYQDVPHGIEKARRYKINPQWQPEDNLSWGLIAARQPGTFFVLNGALTPEGAFIPDPEPKVRGQSFDHYWYADPLRISIATLEDAEADSPEGKTAAFVKNHANSAIGVTQTALYLGMSELSMGEQPVATAWNRFTTSTPMGGKAEGIVSETPTTIRIDYSLAKFDAQFWVELDKPAQPDGRFPTRVRHYRKIQGRVTDPIEGMYYAFDIGTTNFPKGSRGYVPSMFIDPNPRIPAGAPPFMTLIYKAGEIWQISRDGKEQIYPPNRQPGRSNAGSWKLSLALIFTLNAVGFWGYRIIRKKKQRNGPR